MFVPELCDKVRSCDREELAKLLPVLQKRISKAARASTECIKVKDCVQAWWVVCRTSVCVLVSMKGACSCHPMKNKEETGRCQASCDTLTVFVQQAFSQYILIQLGTSLGRLCDIAVSETAMRQ